MEREVPQLASELARAAPSKATVGIANAPSPEAIAKAIRNEKALLLTMATAAGITAYGVLKWDYFQTSPKASSEGWFGRTTKDGGADKLGHLWATYSMGHLFSYIYESWDFPSSDANELGTLSALGVQTLMELGDSFSGEFGFSYEDMIMNMAGAGAAYVLGRDPSLRRMIDIRLEYNPGELGDITDDVLTDYEHQRYLIALKLEGFEILKNSVLGYLELQIGYFARGYDEFRSNTADNRQRKLFVGVGFNFSKLVQKFVNVGIFDYLQVPYTSLRVDEELN